MPILVKLNEIHIATKPFQQFIKIYLNKNLIVILKSPVALIKSLVCFVTSNILTAYYSTRLQDRKLQAEGTVFIFIFFKSFVPKNTKTCT